MINVLVTGGKGQLASCIKDVAANIENLNFIYVDIDQLDITNVDAVKTFFTNNNILFCVNCAAYTAVDKAETDFTLANEVNYLGAKNLAKVCSENSTVMIQISTDFVFDGLQSLPYQESDPTNPLGVYGLTKLQGELAVLESLKEYFILRTSWLYSEHGHNFLKTMLRLGMEREQLNVVCDQIGTPTYAGDLANIILKIIENDHKQYGVYHYSNEGVSSWYDFAKAIFDIRGIIVALLPVKTEAYPTPAIRPSYSVMDKSKIKSTFSLEIPYWRDSLKRVISKINSLETES